MTEVQERYDPTGTLILELRAEPVLMALLGDIAFAVYGGYERVAPPNVTIVPTAISPAPFGPGSNRLGLARYFYTARCKGSQTDAKGEIEALRIAGVVAAILNGKGWRTRAQGVDEDAVRHAIVRSDERATTGPIPDADTKEPTVLVTFDLVATAQAV